MCHNLYMYCGMVYFISRWFLSILQELCCDENSKQFFCQWHILLCSLKNRPSPIHCTSAMVLEPFISSQSSWCAVAPTKKSRVLCKRNHSNFSLAIRIFHTVIVSCYPFKDNNLLIVTVSFSCHLPCMCRDVSYYWSRSCAMLAAYANLLTKIIE